MDVETRISIIARPPTEEIVVYEELKELLETKERPIAYNGFELSGLLHLGTGLISAYKMRDLTDAGIRFKVFLATFHSLINEKLGGNLDNIKKAADYFKHGWIACGVDPDKVEFVIPEEVYDLNYWTKVLNIARKLTIARTMRTLEIMGRKETEARRVADLIYTPMQVADIFQLEVDICQLGMDQRKANMVARELGEKLGFWKPVCVHHHILQGLEKPEVWPLPEGKESKEILSAAKMSKSKPMTAIFIHDGPEDIKKKVMKAFCPEKETSFNPILDIVKHIIFREKEGLTVKTSKGVLEFKDYRELEQSYRRGEVHPSDLKESVAYELSEILSPVREYFEKNPEAKELLRFMKTLVITR